MLSCSWFFFWTYHRFNPKLLTNCLIFFQVVQMHHSLNFIFGMNSLAKPLDWCPLHVLHSSPPWISFHYYSGNSSSLFYIGIPVSWILCLLLGHSHLLSHFGLFSHFTVASPAKWSFLRKGEYEVKYLKSCTSANVFDLPPHLNGSFGID